jgi:hypothetical protein
MLRLLGDRQTPEAETQRLFDGELYKVPHSPVFLGGWAGLPQSMIPLSRVIDPIPK